ncbi:MAG: hypothetical protein M3326_09325 [Actinomycetota bacterium]|nr:hypothetical protein [Actinomycetota bacterium]
MRRLLIGPLAAAAASAALLVGSTSVASATHTVDVAATGTLVAKGAAVIVPVTVTCDPSTMPPFPFPIPGPGSSVSVSVTQRSGNRIVQGYGGAPVTCDGTAQTVDVLVTASGAPFKHGPAVVTVTMFECDVFAGCHPATDTAEITLRK